MVFFKIEWEKQLKYFDRKTETYKPTKQAENPRTLEQAIEISENQCKFDEQKGRLRYSLEQLLKLTPEELIKIDVKRHQDWCNTFGKL